jgi:hypothetical protein
MSRLALAFDPADAPRRSARVARVAELLDCAESDVRRLIRSGELEAHGKGVRGVRVFLDSVRAYQDRQAKPLPPRPERLIHRAKTRSAASTASFRAAMAGLKAKGLA